MNRSAFIDPSWTWKLSFPRCTKHLDPAVRRALGETCKQFNQAVPGLTHARDVLVRFDEYAIDERNRQSKLRNQQGVDAATATRQF